MGVADHLGHRLETKPIPCITPIWISCKNRGSASFLLSQLTRKIPRLQIHRPKIKQVETDSGHRIMQELGVYLTQTKKYEKLTLCTIKLYISYVIRLDLAKTPRGPQIYFVAEYKY